ncbi:MAG: EamA family transporter [Stagnimonas sp.]|nr:EamA family transporter [Stagnimonas sp.]
MRSSVLRVYLALATVYLVWGSTYLAIRWGVAVTPPYLFASVRFLAAGALLLIYVRWRRLPLPRLASDWKVIGLTAVLLLVGANGLVTWSEQWVASNQAALMVATSALWMAGIGSLGANREPQSLATWGGLLVGFLGVVVLVGDGLLQQSAPGPAYLALVISPILWAAGSIYGRRHPLSCPPLVTATFQMLIAGVLMGLIGLAAGEGERWRWTSQSWAAWAYLTVFGSCIAYGAYYWLVHNVTPALLGTYAYVNPAVAVLLGCWLGGESLNRLQVMGTGVILIGVVLVSWSQRPARPVAATSRQ